MSVELSDHVRHSIVALSLYAGWHSEHISRTLKCSTSAVSRTLKRWRDTGDVKDMPRSGRPPKVDISDANNNKIDFIIKRKRQCTGKQVQQALEDKFDTRVHLSTVYKLMNDLKFKAVRYKRVPGLTAAQKEKRLEYVRSMEGEDWKDIIFTDESMFEESNARGTYRKHRKSPSKPKPAKQYPVKVMVWGGIWYDGRTELHICEGKVDSEAYCNILYEHLIQNDQDEYRTVLQDNASSHVSRLTRSFVENFELDIMNNSPHSPDLNPIEKVWGWMKAMQAKEEIHTREALINFLKNLWNSIDQAVIRKWIMHNTTVCQKVEAANGGNI